MHNFSNGTRAIRNLGKNPPPILVNIFKYGLAGRADFLRFTIENTFWEQASGMISDPSDPQSIAHKIFYFIRKESCIWLCPSGRGASTEWSPVGRKPEGPGEAPPATATLPDVRCPRLRESHKKPTAFCAKGGIYGAPYGST